MDFKENAIVLSGITGTKIKSDILGSYYKIWWKITSGRSSREHRYETAIIEMNSATGEVYIEDIKQKIFGSSGHALKLKGDNSNASKLNVILVEEHDGCFSRLQNVIKERWPKINYSFYPLSLEKDWVYLLRKPDEVIEILNKYKIGIALFFFDPLLYTTWDEIEKIAKRRITEYYQIGTEFLIFNFTSDWFKGRGEWNQLPNHTKEEEWTKGELLSVRRCDKMFGNSLWQKDLLRPETYENKIKMMVKLYKRRLQKWFRYILPMPFEPKPGQMYHIFQCSNYEAGVSITRQLYTKFTRNEDPEIDNKKAYKKFLELHPEKQVKRPKKSDEWKILWNIIKNHHDGLCDSHCKELIEKQGNSVNLINALKWLKSKGYLDEIPARSKVWKDPPTSYKLNWKKIYKNFNIDPLPELIPLKPNNTA